MERLSDYDYELPPDRIAQSPLADRAASRLLHLDPRTGNIVHRQFREIVDLLRSGDLLVLNDTRVTAKRLRGTKSTGGAVELLLLGESGDGRFEALVKPSKRLPVGCRVRMEGGLTAEIMEGSDRPKRFVRFEGDPEDVLARLAAEGTVPLPPYIHAALADPERYQTVYAHTGGSAAAPTAGLHFTPDLLAEIEAKGVGIAKVTLDVSLDTFRPVESDDLDQHTMHGERATVPEATRRAIAEAKGRIVAVGTTVVRTLESFAVGSHRVEAGTQITRLFIRPGFRIQVVDGLLTNFHLPRTTMLVLVSSMAGRDHVLAAYRSALQNDYRFLSFGDAMLVL